MADRVRVLCVRKRDRFNPHERIESIGGKYPDGGIWRLPLDEAIAWIATGKWDFYVERPFGDVVDVVVAVSAQGNKYLKTTADGDQPNNLLSLPECP
jgi:hypothetical protein